MEPDGYTTWDRLTLAYPRLHEGVRGTSAPDCLLRCVARVEPYELASRAIKDRGPAAPAAQRALAGLADDYRARCKIWASVAKEPLPRPIGQSLLIVACGLVGPLALAAVVATDSRLTSLRWWPAGLMAAPLLLPLTWTALSAAARAAAPRVSLNQSIHSRRCPDCATLLSAAKPGIDPALVEDADFGPRACPRCRRPWPLLPPPANASFTSDAPTGRALTVRP